jgi:hypothetical protein
MLPVQLSILTNDCEFSHQSYSLLKITHTHQLTQDPRLTSGCLWSRKSQPKTPVPQPPTLTHVLQNPLHKTPFYLPNSN